MAHAQKYICDICGKEIEILDRENVGEAIKDWFSTTLGASPLGSQYGEKRTYQEGHVCSEKCFKEWCNICTQKAKDKM